MIKQTKLIGKKVLLRPLEAKDLNVSYLGWLNDPEVNKYLDVRYTPQTPKTLADYFKRFESSSDDIIFAICDRESGKHIGNVTLNHINKVHGVADTGILIGEKSFWGKGCAYEAWSLLLDYAFNVLNLRKIIAGAVAENVVSLSMQKKLGFKIEGIFRDEVFFDGKFHDVARTALFKKDFDLKL